MKPGAAANRADRITEASIKISGATAIVQALSIFLSAPGELPVTEGLLSDALVGVRCLLESADKELERP